MPLKCVFGAGVLWQDYRSAAPDRVRECAARCVESFNQDRTVDVARIAGLAAGTSIEGLLAAELLWIDSKGIYLWAASHATDGQVAAASLCCFSLGSPTIYRLPGVV
jgi:hypothetical protein